MVALGTRALTLSIGGTDYTGQVSQSDISPGEADSDFLTFLDAANGGAREYRFNFTAVQDTAVGTLWDKVFTSPGSTVACILKPHGSAPASPTTPWFTFNAIVSEPDGVMLGGEADSSATARFTFECSWVLTAKYVKVTA